MASTGGRSCQSAGNRPSPALVIVPDIFGPTPALHTLAGEMAQALATVFDRSQIRIKTEKPIVTDTYGRGRFFREEQTAYAHFTASMDIPAYSRTIETTLAEIEGPVLLIGFSAGASSVWHLAGTRPETTDRIAGAICFYGSQIRHSQTLTPSFRIHHIFPDFEPHFDVDRLMAALSAIPGTSCEKVQGRHGFMNAFSDHFDPDLCQHLTQTVLPDRARGFFENRPSA